MTTATAPQLLTLSDVAEELNTSETAVLRLIALGVLKASQLKEGSLLSFRVTRAALDKYIAAGSQRFKLPRGGEHLAQPASECEWFADKHISFLGRIFDEQLTAAIAQELPDEEDGQLPAGVQANPADGKYRRVELEARGNSIDEVLTMAVPYRKHRMLSSMLPGSPEFEGQWRAAFLVDRLWHFLPDAVEKNGAGGKGLPTIKKLYGLPADFNSLVDTAWERLQQGRIELRRRYEVGFVYRNRELVQTVVGRQQLSLAEPSEVQTIDAAIYVPMSRIASGMKKAVVDQAL